MTIDEALKMAVKDCYQRPPPDHLSGRLLFLCYRIPVCFYGGAIPAQSVTGARLARSVSFSLLHDLD